MTNTTNDLSLSQALREARLDESFRIDAVYAVREAEVARLTLLSDRLAPIFAEIPPSIDLFDVGIVTGNQPRLWVDMVAFVEMGVDKRTYRFLVDNRTGRTLMSETPDMEIVAKTVLDYVARRLIAREQLLAMPMPKSIYEPVTLAEAPVTQNQFHDFDLKEQLEQSFVTKENIIEEATQNALNSVASLRNKVFNQTTTTPLAPVSQSQETMVFTKPQPQTGATGYKDFLSAAKAAARDEASKSATIRAKLQGEGSSKGFMKWFK